MANEAEADRYGDQPLDFSKKTFNPPPPSDNSSSDGSSVGSYPGNRHRLSPAGSGGLLVNGLLPTGLLSNGLLQQSNGLLQQVSAASGLLQHLSSVNGAGHLGNGLLHVSPHSVSQETPPNSEEEKITLPSSRLNSFGYSSPEDNGLLIPAMPVPMDNRKHFKYTRPFKAIKAYPREPLSVPLSYYGLHLTNDALATQTILSSASDQAYLQFRDQMMANKRMQVELGRPKMEGMSVLDDSGDSSDAGQGGMHHSIIPCASPQDLQDNKLSQPSMMMSSSSSNSRKRGRSLPDEMKDEAYWERRRKNNEAAKRSRDARRAKEDEIAIRAAFLEQENLKLKVELASLKSETSKLRHVFSTGYNL